MYYLLGYSISSFYRKKTPPKNQTNKEAKKPQKPQTNKKTIPNIQNKTKINQTSNGIFCGFTVYFFIVNRAKFK